MGHLLMRLLALSSTLLSMLLAMGMAHSGVMVVIISVVSMCGGVLLLVTVMLDMMSVVGRVDIHDDGGVISGTVSGVMSIVVSVMRLLEMMVMFSMTSMMLSIVMTVMCSIVVDVVSGAVIGSSMVVVVGVVLRLADHDDNRDDSTIRVHQRACMVLLSVLVVAMTTTKHWASIMMSMMGSGGIVMSMMGSRGLVSTSHFWGISG